MSDANATGDRLGVFEAQMLEQFRTEPFQNLRFVYGPSFAPEVQGGTCFHKTRRIIEAGRNAGFQVFWHDGVIRLQGIAWTHWVARVHIDGRLFFADMGNGWPSIKLYPADTEVRHRIFGMWFRTEIANGRLSVFHEKHGKESLQLEIDIQPRPQHEVLADLERRASMGHAYPVNSIRFSQVVGDRFLFLRGDRLDVYGENSFECVEGIGEARVAEVLRDYFGLDLSVGADTSTAAP